MRICSDNLLDIATLTGYPAPVENLGYENLRQDVKSLELRTTGQYQNIVLSWDSVQMLNFAHISHHSVSNTGTVQILAYSQENALGTTLYNSGMLNPHPPLSSDENDGGTVFSHWPLGYYFTTNYFDEINNVRSIKIVCQDYSNPIGFFSIGRIFLGKYLELENNFEIGMPFTWETEGDKVITTAGGTLLHKEVLRRRVIKVNTSLLSLKERMFFSDLMGKNTTIFCSAYAGWEGSMERDHCFLAVAKIDSLIPEISSFKTSIELREICAQFS